MGVHWSHLPCLYAIHQDEGIKIHKFQGNVTQLDLDDVQTFIEEFKEGTLPDHKKSQPKGSVANPGLVKVAVGQTFDEIVYDETKEVFVLFHSDT